MAEPLSDRARDVLHAIIREYISTGGPVGSQQLARTSGFEVSSATLRNVMADLEELGYLEKPHTSAGRVPTDRAYRFDQTTKSENDVGPVTSTFSLRRLSTDSGGPMPTICRRASGRAAPPSRTPSRVPDGFSTSSPGTLVSW